MNETVRNALNDQVRREFYAAYLYLAMSAYFEHESLPGFASWMQAQAAEERDHALRIFDHLHDRDARVELQSLDKPPAEWDSPLAAAQAALAHEREVTRHIDELYELARDEGDYPAQLMLEWFVDEQVEEEKTFGDLVTRLERISGDPAGLLVLDGMLAERGEEG